MDSKVIYFQQAFIYFFNKASITLITEFDKDQEKKDSKSI